MASILLLVVFAYSDAVDPEPTPDTGPTLPPFDNARSLFDRLVSRFPALRSVARSSVSFRPAPIYGSRQQPLPDDQALYSVQVDSDTTDIFYDDLANQFVIRPRFAATERPRTFPFQSLFAEVPDAADTSAHRFVLAIVFGLGVAALLGIFVNRCPRTRRAGSHQELPDSPVTALLVQARRVDAIL